MNMEEKSTPTSERIQKSLSDLRPNETWSCRFLNKKALRTNVGDYFPDLDVGKNFLNMTQKF